MMAALTILRGMSHVLVCLFVRPEEESHPTERWQDKSRKLRRGRVVEEIRCIKHLARGATEPRSLAISTTRCDFRTTRTLRTLAS